tara:strand:- start:306 stop:860 length:555 start_codon:yes stop_codon:yes gene_type:complete
MKKCKPGEYYCYTDKKCKKIPMGWHVARGGYIEKDDKDDEKSETKKNGNGGSNGNSNGNGNGGAVSEAAVSKAQQRFFGMVRAAQKGEMENPSPEVAKVAASAKRSDVKKFASTKHDKLPEKKKMEEETKYDRYDKEKTRFAKADKKMKFGKFYDKAKEAQTRLRKGEVKKWDPEKKRYVSNRD